MAYTTLGSAAIGSVVKIKEDGTLFDYILINHNYLATGNQLLMRKNTLYYGTAMSCAAYSQRVSEDVGSSNLWYYVPSFSGSALAQYLNGDFYNLIAAEIRSQLKQVGIPTFATASSGYPVTSNYNCKIFALSEMEVFGEGGRLPKGRDEYDGIVTVGGSYIPYFAGSAELIKSDQKYAIRDAVDAGYAEKCAYVDAAGKKAYGSSITYFRPCLVLPDTIYIADDGSLTTNTAPTVPGSITVPTTIKGGETAAISWAVSTDAEGNLTGYILDRQYNGGAWTQLYKGGNRSYTDNITKGWTSVAYRVKAYDAAGAESAYKTSSTVTVNNNTAPVISGSDGSLGAKTGAFNQTYTITDVDAGQTLTVVEKLDGVTRRTYTATSGATNTFAVTAADWIKVLNGTHTIVVTASDGNGGSATRTWTFSKSVTEIEFGLLKPFSADAMPTKGIASISGEIPPGAVALVEVCNNAFDAAPTWQDVTSQVLERSKFFFANTVKTASKWGVGIRVKVNRNGAVGACYIQSIGGNFE